MEFILFFCSSIFLNVDNGLAWVLQNIYKYFKEGKNVFCCYLDGNCIHMVDNGIVEKLMDLLDRHVEDGNVTVQHAALSALRNLAIPGTS